MIGYASLCNLDLTKRTYHFFDEKIIYQKESVSLHRNDDIIDKVAKIVALPPIARLKLAK